jgi:hypothetical protein
VKVEGYLFGFLALFFIPVTAVYWVLSEDWTGTTCLVLTFFLAAMVAYYLMFTARRMEARPEDRPDAEIAEGAGEVGFFPPHSWWPIVLAAGAITTFIGLIIGLFLALIGVGIVAMGVLGMTFEYYVGINRSQGQTLGALQAMGEQPTSTHKFLGE